MVSSSNGIVSQKMPGVKWLARFGTYIMVLVNISRSCDTVVPSFSRYDTLLLVHLPSIESLPWELYHFCPPIVAVGARVLRVQID